MTPLQRQLEAFEKSAAALEKKFLKAIPDINETPDCEATAESEAFWAVVHARVRCSDLLFDINKGE